jgi:two-component system NarL family sensor kinase
MRKWICTIAALYIVQIGKAQLIYSLDDDREYVTRMEKKAAEATTDSARAYAYLRLSPLYRITGDTSKARESLQRGINLSKPGTFTEAASWFYKAQSLYASRNFPLIESHLLTGDSLLAKFNTKEAAKIRAYIWHAYGTIQQMKGSEKDAMNAFLNKALPLAGFSEDRFMIANVNKTIATVCMNAERRKEAAGYLRAAIDNIQRATHDNPMRLETLVECCVYAAENFVYDHLPDSAKIQLDKAAEVLKINPRSNLYLTYYYAEGAYYDKTKQYAQAVASFNKGIALGKDVPAAQFSVNRLLYAKYKSLYNRKDYNAAIPVMLQLLKSPLVFTTDKKIYYKELSEIYAATGNKSAAYDFAAKYIALSDSLYEARFQNDIVELERKYNNAENQKKIVLLQAEKEKAMLTSRNNKLLAWLLGGCSVFLLVLALLGWLLYRNKKKLAEQQDLNHQQQLTEISQLQQLKMTEALLQGEERERKRLAGDLHDGLGGMLAGVKMNLSRLSPANSEAHFANDLPAIIHQLDRSVNELRRIARNMMPESLLTSGLEAALRETCESFSSKEQLIEFQAFNLEHTIPKELQVTIFRIVQELVTNAIRHSGASSVLVQCSQNEQVFYITVEDNGKGFQVDQLRPGKGIGLTNVKNRVDYLKGSLDIDTAPGAGTTINIEFNVR